MAASHSDALVLFGVTGDLAHKMIFPALYAMVKRGVLKTPIIGVALPKWSLERHRPWAILQAERWAPRTLHALRLHRHEAFSDSTEARAITRTIKN
jgi:glucose-6-phosphate 1-dehydrogenase